MLVCFYTATLTRDCYPHGIESKLAKNRVVKEVVVTNNDKRLWWNW